MLPKTAEYALRAVACLASDPVRSRSADHLATQTQIPRRYLHKVLQDLAEAGLLSSRSGPGGGYVLAQSPDTISLLAVINAVSPLERIRSCPLGLPSHTKLCPLHRELDRAYAAIERTFAGLTMGELLRSTNGVIPLCDLNLSQIASG